MGAFCGRAAISLSHHAFPWGKSRPPCLLHSGRQLCSAPLVPHTWPHPWPVPAPSPSSLGSEKGVAGLSPACVCPCVLVFHAPVAHNLRPCAPAGTAFVLPRAVTSKRGWVCQWPVFDCWGLFPVSRNSTALLPPRVRCFSDYVENWSGLDPLQCMCACDLCTLSCPVAENVDMGTYDVITSFSWVWKKIYSMWFPSSFFMVYVRSVPWISQIYTPLLYSLEELTGNVFDVKLYSGLGPRDMIGLHWTWQFKQFFFSLNFLFLV